MMHDADDLADDDESSVASSLAESDSDTESDDVRPFWNEFEFRLSALQFSYSVKPCFNTYILKRKHRAMCRHFRKEIRAYQYPGEIALEIVFATLFTIQPWWASPAFVTYLKACLLEQQAIEAEGCKRFRKAATLRARKSRLLGQPRIYNFLKRVPRTGWEKFVHIRHGESVGRDLAFRRLIRMDLADFDALMHIIGNHPSLQRKAEMALRSDIVACCPRTIVAVTLMYLGGQSNICIADQFGLHHDTVPQLARLGVRAILDNEQQFIDPNPFASPQKLQKLATGFNKRTYKYDEGVRTMQGCVGALDGIVIRMLKPDVPEHGRFRSRKGYHALTFQCMCDADHVFTFVSDWFYGSTSDSSAFKDTALYHAIYDKKVLGPSHYIIADNAYACTDQVLTPYSLLSPTNMHISFNVKLSSLRCRIEITFGVLTNRFRILRHIPTKCVQFAQGIFRACCLLHNFCRRRNLDVQVKSVYRRDSYQQGQSSNGSAEVQDFSTIVVSSNEEMGANFEIDTGGGRAIDYDPSKSMAASRRADLTRQLKEYWQFQFASEQEPGRTSNRMATQRRDDRARKRQRLNCIDEASDPMNTNNNSL